ncbi:MAG: 4Fe-4S cluster-binding domain-containing protein, partial [Clostridia bacterium]|nr:4Fe-4S cluster-binding domain-containing protein [Clostridia bacterium]
MTGRIHSLQSLGTVDGPGIRYVVFLQGCNLRCGCCHNPDTWDMSQGTKYTAEEILQKVLRFREYFGTDGGITVSGGEPLLQAEFCTELFSLCHENGINTCLDTSGSILNDSVKKLLSHTDRVLLDIKYTTDSLYQKYVGCSMDKPLAFLAYLNEKKIP